MIAELLPKPNPLSGRLEAFPRCASGFPAIHPLATSSSLLRPTLLTPEPEKSFGLTRKLSLADRIAELRPVFGVATRAATRVVRHSSPLIERKAASEALAHGRSRPSVNDRETGGGERIRKHALGPEGIVSKIIDAPYALGNRGLRRKSKCLNRQEFVVVGWTDRKARGLISARCCSAITPMTASSSMPAASALACRTKCAPTYITPTAAAMAKPSMPLSAPPPRATRFGSPLVLSRVHWVEPKLVGTAKEPNARKPKARKTSPATQHQAKAAVAISVKSSLSKRAVSKLPHAASLLSERKVALCKARDQTTRKSSRTMTASRPFAPRAARLHPESRAWTRNAQSPPFSRLRDQSSYLYSEKRWFSSARDARKRPYRT